MQRFPCLVVAAAVLFGSMAGAATSDVRRLETFKVVWRKGAPPYTLIVESGPRSDGVTIIGPGNRATRFWLPNEIVANTDSFGHLARPNLIHSKYLLLSPKLSDANGDPALLMPGSPDASEPGAVRIIGLDAAGVPTLLYRNDFFSLEAIADLDGDGRTEIAAKHNFGQETGCLHTYDPFYVYKLTKMNKLEYSGPLTRSYNLRHYYWAGVDRGEDVMVSNCDKRHPHVVRAQ